MALYGGLSLRLYEARVDGLILSAAAMSLSLTFTPVVLIISLSFESMVLNSFMVDHTVIGQER